MKHRVPHFILATIAILLILTPFIASPGADGKPSISRIFAYLDENFSVWFNILAVFAFSLGAASLLRTHVRKVVSRQAGWAYSLVTLVSFTTVLVIGLLKLGGPPGLAGDVAAPDSWLTWVFEWIYDPLKSTIYSLLAFFVASAAYRAFRLTSVEAGVLLAAAFIILLGRTPFGVTLTAWLPDTLHFLRIDQLSLWIMQVPNTAGWRAVLIGIALGTVSMSLRLILGLERNIFTGGRR
jgi:hypothetical protein